MDIHGHNSVTYAYDEDDDVESIAGSFIGQEMSDDEYSQESFGSAEFQHTEIQENESKEADAAMHALLHHFERANEGWVRSPGTGAGHNRDYTAGYPRDSECSRPITPRSDMTAGEIVDEDLSTSAATVKMCNPFKDDVVSFSGEDSHPKQAPSTTSASSALIDFSESGEDEELDNEWEFIAAPSTEIPALVSTRDQSRNALYRSKIIHNINKVFLDSNVPRSQKAAFMLCLMIGKGSKGALMSLDKIKDAIDLIGGAVEKYGGLCEVWAAEMKLAAEELKTEFDGLRTHDIKDIRMTDYAIGSWAKEKYHLAGDTAWKLLRGWGL